jgi:excisionase family DNA binding protein
MSYHSSFETVVPTANDALMARDSSRMLAAAYSLAPMHITVQNGKTDVEVVLPASAAKVLVHVLQEMAAGHSVIVMPNDTEISTQEAAELLNVSRPFLVQQLEKGVLPFRMVGSHRRFRLQEVLHYRQHVFAERETALNALVQQAQELDMGY